MRTKSFFVQHIQSGFTLFEVILAVTILGGVSVVLAQSFFATTRGNTKSEIVSDIKQGGDFALRIMEQHIRGAQVVTSTCSSGGTQGRSVTLTNADGGTSTFGCSYDSTNSISRIASSSGASTQYLTPTNVTLGGSSCLDNAMTLRFTCTSYPGQPSAVKVEFSLAQRGTPVDRFAQARSAFQTTVNVRN